MSHSVAECVRLFGVPLIDSRRLPGHVSRTLWRISNCRTEGMGSHQETCPGCGHTRLVHNSCRDRNCPVCQGARRREWTQRRKEELLPVTYFHTVFTLPSCLNPEVLAHMDEAFPALFMAASQTLTAFARSKGVQPGFTAVLHTWGSNLEFHPHLHCIVAGGGVDMVTGKWKRLPWVGRARDGTEPFLFPVKAMSKMFRAKFMAGFSKTVTLSTDIRERCFEKPWVVYSKAPTCNPDKVVEYLARYAYRTAISDSRIISVTTENVTFRYRDYRRGGGMSAMTLPGAEFIRRYAMHIAPKGLMRIRHYGFLAPCNRKKLIRLQLSFGVHPIPTSRPRPNDPCRLMALGIRLRKCPHCGSVLIITRGQTLARPPTQTTNHATD